MSGSAIPNPDPDLNVSDEKLERLLEVAHGMVVGAEQTVEDKREALRRAENTLDIQLEAQRRITKEIQRRKDERRG